MAHNSLKYSLIEFFRATKKEIEALMRRYSVPGHGKHYNRNIQLIYQRLKNAGFKDTDFVPPQGQYNRLKALGRSLTWKSGYLMVENGQLKYPYINEDGIPMVSGIRAAIFRANTQQEYVVQEIASEVLKMVNENTKVD